MACRSLLSDSWFLPLFPENLTSCEAFHCGNIHSLATSTSNLMHIYHSHWSYFMLLRVVAEAASQDWTQEKNVLLKESTFEQNQSLICTDFCHFLNLTQWGIVILLQDAASPHLFDIIGRMWAGVHFLSCNSLCQMSQEKLRVLDLSH